MTVPSDAGKAESLMRPTASASVGAGGLSSMGVPDPGPRRSSSKRNKGKKGKSKRRVSATVEAGEYQTASGKVIRLDETTRVPMAEGKRKKIRAATTAVFFSIVGMVVIIAVIAIVMITGGPGGPGGSGDVSYNPADNPYVLEYANVMGLPVTNKTVVIIEASEYSGEWVEAVADIVGAGLSQEPSGGEIALIGAGGTPVSFSGGGYKDMPVGAGEVRGWFEKLPATGTGDVSAAISAALSLNPDTLIVVHGYAEMSDIEAWDKLVKGKEGLTIHTVHIGNSSPELSGWAGAYAGEAVVLSIQDIEALKDLAAEATAEEE